MTFVIKFSSVGSNLKEMEELRFSDFFFQID